MTQLGKTKVDTCNWIYLAKDLPDFRQKIIDLEQSGEITIVLPKPVEDEWERNKNPKVIRSITQRLGTLRKNTKDFIKLLPNDKQELVLTVLDEEITEDKIEQYAQQGAEEIDQLFTSARIVRINPSDETKVAATGLAMDKKAPFRKRREESKVEKNSMADALILLSFLEYLDDNGLEGAFFISSNTKDFAGENKREIHPDLAPLLEPNNVQYYVNIGEALQQIEPNLVSDEEVAEIEDFQNSLDLLESIYSSSLNSSLLAFSTSKIFSDTLLSSFGSESSIQQAVESIRSLNVNVPDLSGVNTTNQLLAETIVSSFGSESSIQKAVESIQALNVNVPDLSGVSATNQLLAETIVSSFGSESSIQKALQNVRSLSLNVNLPDFSGLHARNKLLSDTLMSSFGSESSLQKTLTEIQMSLGEGLANSAKRPHSEE